MRLIRDYSIQVKRRAWGDRCFVAVIAASLLAISDANVAAQDTSSPPPVEIPETEVIGEPPSDAANPNSADAVSTQPLVPSNESPFDGALEFNAPSSFQPSAPSPATGSPNQPTNVASQNPFDDAPGSTEGYRASESTVGSLIPIDNLELPASTSTITEDLLDDQQVLRITDALRNVPAATPVGDALYGDRFFLRGLEVRSRDFRKNGFLDPTFTPRDFANVERVEILKGPASVLYGSAAPSGTINVITKKPIDRSFTNYDYQFGSFGLNRHQLDTGGRVKQDGSLLYRFNGAYEDSDSFRDFGFTERYQIAPSLRWFLNRDTMLTWETEIVENKRRGDVGIAAIGGDVLALPVSRYLGEPANDFFNTRDYRTSVVLDHRFTDDWGMQVGASTVFYEIDGSQTLPVGQAGGQIFRTRQNYVGDEQASSLIANLTGRFCTGILDHRFVVGTEQVYYDSDTTIGAFNLDPIDAFNPVYVNPTAGAPVFFADFPVFRQVRHGYYLQDFITVNPHLQLLAGVRFDNVNLTYDRDFGFGPTRTEQEFNQTTPRVGVVVQPIPEMLSTYFNYSRSFNPPGGGGFPFTSDPVQAEKGELFEGGIKSLLLENLVLHVAGFHVTRQNVPFSTFGAFGPEFYQVGQERSQGAEIELLGQVTERWSVIGNYAYVDTKLTDPQNPAFNGQRSRNVPLNQWSLWTRYNVLACRHQTLGLAGGFRYLDERTANLAGTVQLPSYIRWDAGAYYQRGVWDTALFVENLFDTEYAASSINENQVMPGAPATLRAQIGARF
ncbi:TonB-dependent siderophore receptor [Gimesia maris]|uniref:TonB-dependent siderophore receptor n=1 Tax=Gimesia maris TaxID=122 RepID=UPI003A9295D3